MNIDTFHNEIFINSSDSSSDVDMTGNQETAGVVCSAYDFDRITTTIDQDETQKKINWYGEEIVRSIENYDASYELERNYIVTKIEKKYKKANVGQPLIKLVSRKDQKKLYTLLLFPYKFVLGEYVLYNVIEPLPLTENEFSEESYDLEALQEPHQRYNDLEAFYLTHETLDNFINRIFTGKLLVSQLNFLLDCYGDYRHNAKLRPIGPSQRLVFDNVFDRFLHYIEKNKNRDDKVYNTLSLNYRERMLEINYDRKVWRRSAKNQK